MRRKLTTLERYQRGLLTFEQVANESRWRRFAGKLRSRWRQPEWVADADVVQDVLIGAWHGVNTHDPTRGASLDRYVNYTAIDYAKKRAHVARLGRRPHRGEDKAPSCFEIPFSRRLTIGYVDSGASEPADWLDQADAAASMMTPAVDPEAHAVRRQRIAEMMAAATDTHERLCVAALAASDGTFIGAAAMLFDNEHARRVCQIWTESQALRVMRVAFAAIAKRMGVEV